MICFAANYFLFFFYSICIQTTATKDPDDEPKIDDFDWQGDVYQHRKTIDAKDPDIYHYELGADIEGYKFQ